jgi:hypothetical protein
MSLCPRAGPKPLLCGPVNLRLWSASVFNDLEGARPQAFWTIRIVHLFRRGPSARLGSPGTSKSGSFASPSMTALVGSTFPLIMRSSSIGPSKKAQAILVTDGRSLTGGGASHVDRRRGDRWQQLVLRIFVEMIRMTIFSVKM